MLEVDFRPIAEDDLEGGLDAGYGRGLGYAAIFVLVDDSVRILPAKRKSQSGPYVGTVCTTHQIRNMATINPLQKVRKARSS
jgi:hypothetical protein